MPPALRAFIVEDSDLILNNLISTLEELAPVVVVGSAPDEPAALRWLQAQGRDTQLVIVDVFLKSGSGLGVLAWAQRLSLPARRVVLTNYATAEVRARCTALGADRVFDKSTDLDDLLQYCTELGRGPAAPGSAA